MVLASKYSFRLLSREKIDKLNSISNSNKVTQEEKESDSRKRSLLKLIGVVGAGAIVSSIIPKKAEALVFGSTPTSNVVGVKNSSNIRINPALEDGGNLASVKTNTDNLSGIKTGTDNLSSIKTATDLIKTNSDKFTFDAGNNLKVINASLGVSKSSISLSASGNVVSPATGKKIRVYASRFSLTADASSVSFRFTSGGTDHEKYVSPKTGGLYGANNHPNYIEGGIDEVLYCVISGTTTVQINTDYLEV